MIFEFRTYRSAPGAVDRLHERFASETIRIFERHGIRVLEFWVDTEDPTVVYYLVAHRDSATREAAWSSFSADPEWHAVKQESEVDGPLVENIEKLTMRRTSYSPGRIPAD